MSSTMRPSRSAIVRAQLSATCHVVRDDQDGRAQALVQIVDQRQNLLAGVRIEIAGGLVGQQNRRIDGERARDGDALALAAGKFVGQVREAVRELHQVQQLAGAFVDLPRPAAQMQRQRDILETRQRRQQVEELENESDLVAAHPGQVIVGQAASGSPSIRTRLTSGGRGRRSD